MDRPAPRMIPVRYLSDPARIAYEEVRDCAFDRPTFDLSLQAWQDAGNTSPCVEVPLDRIQEQEEHESLPPALFVFHMSRCGSTLLARVLAQSPRHFVISEANVLNEALWFLADEDLGNPLASPAKTRSFRRLALAMMRKRDTPAERCIIKFTSWNVLLLPFIQRAFPDTPTLFLYRRPEEVMVSCLEKPPSFLAERGTDFSASLLGISRRRVLALSEVEYLARCLRHMILRALSAKVPLLDYEYLTPTRLAPLLDHFRIPHTPAELAAMRAFFDTDSKRDVPYEDDRERKQAAATGEIRAAVGQHLRHVWQRIQISPFNLGPRLNPPTSHAG